MEYFQKSNSISVKEISEWEKYFKLPMPSELKELLLESNGSCLYNKESKKEIQLMSAVNAIEYYEAYQFDKYLSDAIPICMDGYSNFVVYKIHNGKVEAVYVMSASNLDWEDSVNAGNCFKKIIEMEETVEDLLRS